MIQLRFLASYAMRDQYDPRPVIAAIPSWAPKPMVMLDSGAFSAHSRGTEVTVPGLSAWYSEHLDLDPLLAGLDVIGDAKATRRNCEAMRDLGLDVFPTVHLGAPPSLIADYKQAGWSMLALGGLVNKRVPVKTRAAWARACQKVAADNDVNLHGFGWTPQSRSLLDTVRRCWSVDSSSWNRGTKFGQVPLLDGHHLSTVPIADKESVHRVLGQDRDVQADAVMTALRWANKKAKGQSTIMYAIGAYAYLRWGDVIGTNVFIASTTYQPVQTLYEVVLRQPEGAVA